MYVNICRTGCIGLFQKHFKELETRDEAKGKARNYFNFLYQSFKKKRRKPQETQRNKKVCVKPHLKNRFDSNAYNNLLHMQFLRLKSVKSLKIIHCSSTHLFFA